MRARIGVIGTLIVSVLLTVLLVTGCTSAGSQTRTAAGGRSPAPNGSQSPAPTGSQSPIPASSQNPPTARIELPPPGQFDYQLGGSYAPPSGAGVVERDSTEPPAPGRYGICYVNGFQSQPGAHWPDELLLHRPSGELLVDPGWPDEHLFDISTPSHRAELARRQTVTIDHCQSAGFRAVEFDNLDSYTRSDGAITLDDAIAFARLLVQQAHAVGLAAAQKNTAELGTRGRDEIDFDFAITEECDQYRECDTFTRVYGNRVFDIEYTDDLRGAIADICARIHATTPAPNAIIRDRELLPQGSPGYAYSPC